MKYPRYPKYKDSGVEWLGVIPDTWQVLRAKNMFHLAKRPASEEHEIVTAFRDGQVTLRINRRIDGFTNAIKEIGYQGVCKGDLVIHAMDAFAGAVGVSDSDGKCTPVYSCCIPNKEINSKFYANLVRTMALTGFIESLAKGIRERSTDFRWIDFSTLFLPVPSFEEQQRIDAFIDNETTKIDSLIAEQEKLITLLREKRQAVISHAVTKGLNPDAPVKDSGVAWLGEVPDGWEIERLKNLSSIIGGGTPSKDKLEYWIDGTVPWVSPKDMKKRIIVTTEDYITEQAVQESATNFVEKNTPLLVVRSGILRHTIPIAVSGCRLTINQDIKAILLSKKILASFFLYWVKGKNDDLLLAWGQIGATVESIDIPLMMGSIFPLPPLSEQQAIVAHLDAETAKIDALIAESEKAVALLRERRSALISAAVTGKIDVRDIPLQEAV